MALWTSVSANIARNSIINAVEISSYDQYKQMVLESGMLKDGTPCHLLCAAGAGLNATIFGSPVDVLTTRHMNSPGRYKGPIDVIATTLRQEGFFALYKGFIPNVFRLSLYNIVFWLTIEKIKKIMDM